MTNEEDKQLDSIIIEKNAPSRVDDKESKTKKVAKLTGRTISSLKTKIKEKRLTKAYQKYNKKYQQMKNALIDAESVRKEKKEGADITESELAVEYSIAASYSKKLGKLGAKLLKDDISKVVAYQTVKPIRVPRFLQTKLHKLTLAVVKIRDKRKTKKLHKEMTKEIQGTTRDYIQSSLETAIFKDTQNRILKEQVDKDVIKNLSLKGGKDNTERRLDTLKGFISKDGENPMFRINDEELEKKSKASTDLPPTEPSATVEKEAPKVNVNDLIKGFENKKEEVIEETVKKESESTKNTDNAHIINDTTVSDVVSDLPEANKTHASTDVDNRKKEINAITACGATIKELETTLKGIKDSKSREVIKEKIVAERDRLIEIIKGKPLKSEEFSRSTQKDNLEPIEIKVEDKQIESEHKVKKTTDAPAQVGSPNISMENVEMTNPESIRRAEQISTPVALRVTLEDIKKLETRNKAAQLEIARLKEEKETLENQKKLLKEYIEVAKITRENERQATTMAMGNATLKGEVDELSSKAAAIDVDLGRTR